MNTMATAMTVMVQRAPSPVVPDPAIVARLSALESGVGQILAALDVLKNRV